MLRSTLTLLLLGVAAFAQTAPTEKMPALGAPKPFVPPVRQTSTLKNGLKVSLVPFGNTPLVTVAVRLDSGNVNESRDQQSVADLLGELMKEGAAGKTGQQIAEAASSMGGQLFVQVTPDQTIVSMDVLSEYAADAVKLLADVVQRPTLPESELPRLKNNLLRGIAVQRTRPGSLANEALAKALFGSEHPYAGVIPDPEVVKKLGIDDVKSFYAANYGAARAHVYVVGKFDPAVKTAVDQAFSGWTKGNPVERKVPKMEAKKRFIVIDRPGASQSVLRVAMPLTVTPGQNEFVPASVLNLLLGGAFISRITNNIREEKGYTYSPFSTVVTNYKTPYWVQNADVTTAVTGASLEEILKEINTLRKEAPSDEELKRIKNFANGIFVLRNSDSRSILSQFAFIDRHEITDAYLKTYTQKVSAVSRQDIQRLAETYLNPEKMTYVVVGDRSKIDSQLEPFKKGSE